MENKLSFSLYESMLLWLN